MTTAKGAKTRGPAALYRALTEQAALDDLDAIAAMTDDELDSHIREQGGDPAAIRESGRALLREEEDRRARLPWHKTMDEKLDQLRTLAKGASAGRVRLPREELLSRIEAARKDPRFSGPVSALFQRKTAEASSDEELDQLLTQIELLAKLEEP